MVRTFISVLLVSFGIITGNAQEVEFTLDAKGITSLKASGAGADGHNFVNPDGQRGTLRADVYFVRPDGTTYGFTHFDRKSFTQSTDDATQTITRTFTDQATVAVTYSSSGNKLIWDVAVTNLHPTDALAEASLNFMSLYFPQGATPRGWRVDLTPEADGIVDPAILFGDYTTGKIALYTESENNAGLRFGSRHYDGFEVWGLCRGKEVAPGTRVNYRFVLAFGGADETEEALASNAYDAWRETNTQEVLWKDRRPIGATFLASSFHRSSNNPRGWFNDANLPLVDTITGAPTPEGMAEFRKRLLERADREIANLTAVGSQGIVVWDVEGSRHGHPITFIGDPRLLSTITPEMDYKPAAGSLATVDAYFKKLRDAGFRVGLTVRPQTPQLGDDDPAGTLVRDQIKVPTQEEALAVLDAKVTYAIDRWGATLFYVDTDVVGEGGMFTSSTGYVAAWVYAELMSRHPGILFIPELNTVTSIASAAAKYKELDLLLPRTSDGVRRAYPNSFSTINIMDGDFEAKYDDILLGVKRGDILMHRAWFSDSKNPKVIEIYQRALSENTGPTADLIVSPVDGQERTVKLDARGATDDGSIAVYRWSIDDGSAPFETSQSVVYRTLPSSEDYTVTLTVDDNFGVSSAPVTRTTAANTATVPSETAILLPGRLEAEDFDEGGEGVGYSDKTSGNTGKKYRTTDVDIESSSEGGFNVGWIKAGEWLAFTVDVATSGDYELVARVASAVSGNHTFHFEADGTDITGPISFTASAGWQVWQDVIVSSVYLKSGGQNLRIVFDSDLFNLNYVDVELPTSEKQPSSVASSYQAREDGGLRVFPNPTANKVSLVGIDEGNVVSVVNLLGAVQGEFLIREGQRSINLNGLPAGCYVINILESEVHRRVLSSERVIKE